MDTVKESSLEVDSRREKNFSTPETSTHISNEALMKYLKERK